MGTQSSAVYLVTADAGMPDEADMCTFERLSLNNEPQIRSALAFEPPPGSAPRKYAYIFSCSRTEIADDGKRGGTSPWTQAVLHEQRGFFAQGVTLQEAITFVSNDVESGGSQKPIEYQITSTIPRDFCIWPAAGAGGGYKREREVDANVMLLLRQFGLEEEAERLADNGVCTLTDWSL